MTSSAAPGRRHHLVRHGRGEHLARTGRVEHARADEAAVQRLVPRTAAGHHSDLPADRGVAPEHDLVLVVHPQVRVGRGHAAERLGYQVGGVVDELLHRLLLTSTP